MSMVKTNKLDHVGAKVPELDNFDTETDHDNLIGKTKF